MTKNAVRIFGLTATTLVALFLFASSLIGQTLPNETPHKFTPTNDGFDYVRREEMIPMRDGVKLHTVILVPKGASHAPILLTRTPYSADQLTSHAPSAHLGPNLYGYDNATEVIVEDGYIPVIQDIPGKYRSARD